METSNPGRAGSAVNPAELWTVKDVARYMRVSPSWVYKNYHRHFTVYRTGHLLRFAPDEVRTAVQQLRQQPE